MGCRPAEMNLVITYTIRYTVLQTDKVPLNSRSRHATLFSLSRARAVPSPTLTLIACVNPPQRSMRSCIDSTIPCRSCRLSMQYLACLSAFFQLFARVIHELQVSSPGRTLVRFCSLNSTLGGPQSASFSRHCSGLLARSGCLWPNQSTST
jgi:hypothetical protein